MFIHYITHKLKFFDMFYRFIINQEWCFIFNFFNLIFFIAIGLQNFQTNSTILQFPVTLRTGLIRVCVLSVFANNYISYDTVKNLCRTGAKTFQEVDKINIQVNEVTLKFWKHEF